MTNRPAGKDEVVGGGHHGGGLGQLGRGGGAQEEAGRLLWALLLQVTFGKISTSNKRFFLSSEPIGVVQVSNRQFGIGIETLIL